MKSEVSDSSLPAPIKAAVFWLDRVVATATQAALWLVLPLSLLLFLQWPLREWVRRGSHQADDFAQILFALYVAAAVTYATRRRGHLAADVVAHRYAPRVRSALERAAALLVALPWSLFVLYATWPSVMQSVSQWEAFPETYNPGYFLLRISVVLLAALVALDAAIVAAGGRR